MRDAIDMAREAGIDEWWDNGGDWRETFNEHLKAFEALVRADECALAAPVQEPVGEWVDGRSEAKRIAWKPGYVVNANVGEKIYATPPAQRQWVGLTDEEILKLAYPIRWQEVDDFEADKAVNFAQAIEAKLKEKNT